jgi:hypothetical protein
VWSMILNVQAEILNYRHCLNISRTFFPVFGGNKLEVRLIHRFGYLYILLSHFNLFHKVWGGAAYTQVWLIFERWRYTGRAWDISGLHEVKDLTKRDRTICKEISLKWDQIHNNLPWNPYCSIHARRKKTENSQLFLYSPSKRTLNSIKQTKWVYLV